MAWGLGAQDFMRPLMHFDFKFLGTHGLDWEGLGSTLVSSAFQMRLIRASFYAVITRLWWLYTWPRWRPTGHSAGKIGGCPDETVQKPMPIFCQIKRIKQLAHFILFLTKDGTFSLVSQSSIWSKRPCPKRRSDGNGIKDVASHLREPAFWWLRSLRD